MSKKSVTGKCQFCDWTCEKDSEDAAKKSVVAHERWCSKNPNRAKRSSAGRKGKSKKVVSKRGRKPGTGLKGVSRRGRPGRKPKLTTSLQDAVIQKAAQIVADRILG